MTIRLPPSKLKRVRKEARRLSESKIISARKLASAIGLLNSTSEAVLPARLKHRWVLADLHRLLKEGNGNWEFRGEISEEAKKEMSWWSMELSRWNGRALIVPTPDFEAETDASDLGWGACVKNSTFAARGSWSEWESKQSINYRELLAIYFLVRLKTREWKNKTVKIWTDNVSARAYINHQGGTASAKLNELAMKLWSWCLRHRITLSADYIPGLENGLADYLSRTEPDRHDWILDRKVFQALQRERGPFVIDLFASRLSRQVENYFSWGPDPEAAGTDAFAHRWPSRGAYANPPWGLIPKVIEKIRKEKCKIVLVTPRWPTQHWYADLLQLSYRSPIVLPKIPNLLRPTTWDGNRGINPSRWDTIAWTLSGDTRLSRAFRRKLKSSSKKGYDPRPGRTTMQTGGNSIIGVLDGKLIQATHLAQW